MLCVPHLGILVFHIYWAINFRTKCRSTFHTIPVFFKEGRTFHAYKEGKNSWFFICWWKSLNWTEMLQNFTNCFQLNHLTKSNLIWICSEFPHIHHRSINEIFDWIIFDHSDFSLTQLLTNVFFTKSQKFLLHLHKCNFCAYHEKLECLQALSSSCRATTWNALFKLSKMYQSI